MVAALWERKIRHLTSMSLEENCLLLWRWISHKRMMLSDDAADDVASGEDHDDPDLTTFCQVVSRYRLLAYGKQDFVDNQRWQIEALFARTTEAFSDLPQEIQQQATQHILRWRELLTQPRKLLVQAAMQCVTAEGNLRMLRRLHEEEGGDLHAYGWPWGMSLLQFAAGKGHIRVLRYILENGGVAHIDDKTPRQGICAIDRACKAGFVDVVKLLIEYGASYRSVTRHNGETLVHGAAITGQVDVLRELHALGCDMHAETHRGLTPQACALRYHQCAAADYLASLPASIE
mmetsp:Transcript_74488/g.223935  ORF Transcript_74488/g.223935 Transcript_74488/m.223935 type:complete len:290 (-) Transcript_74488:188-1057(-)